MIGILRLDVNYYLVMYYLSDILSLDERWIIYKVSLSETDHV